MPVKYLLIITLTLSLLSACGGGGGSSVNDDDNTNPPVPTTAPLAPSLNLTYQQIKTFQLSWEDVADETEYRLMENPDGVSGFSQVATIAADNTSHDLVVSLPARVNASYMLQACNDIGCSDSDEVTVDVTQLVQAVGYVKASNTGANDSFGLALAVSADGTTLAVGAWSEDSNATGIGENQNDNTAINSGAVYVFTRTGSVWSQQAYIKASNTDAEDRFGFALALSDNGSTLAVGAIYEASSATGIDGDQNDNTVSLSGATYVFTRTGTFWRQQAYLKASNTGESDRFGFKVALNNDGNTLAVSAYLEASNATGIDGNQNDNTASTSGAVYVFTRTGNVWSQQAYIKASNTDAGDRFGYALALSDNGDTLAVGAFYESSNATGVNDNQNQSDNSTIRGGAAYVFSRTNNIWNQQAYIKASNTGEDDRFGSALALSADGDTLAVSAPFEDSNTSGIDGNQNDNTAINSGAVYIFTRTGATWSQQTYLKASNTEENDWFGFAIAFADNGNTLAVGTFSEDSNATGINGDQSNNSANDSGAVYTFISSAGSWRQQAYLKASNTGSKDSFGVSVNFSGDGEILAVGASLENSNATGINGDQTDNSVPNAGAVYLY